MSVAETKGESKRHVDKSVINSGEAGEGRVAEMERKMFNNGEERLKEEAASFYLTTLGGEVVLTRRAGGNTQRGGYEGIKEGYKVLTIILHFASVVSHMRLQKFLQALYILTP